MTEYLTDEDLAHAWRKYRIVGGLTDYLLREIWRLRAILKARPASAEEMVGTCDSCGDDWPGDDRANGSCPICNDLNFGDYYGVALSHWRYDDSGEK